LRQVVSRRYTDDAGTENNDAHENALAETAIDGTDSIEAASIDHCSNAYNFRLWECD
jgi:hypothetical protein